MKKNLRYVILALVFIGAAGFVVLKFKKGQSDKATASYNVLERKGIQANTPEWQLAKQSVDKLLQVVDDNPYDKRSLISLSNYMIMEARASGNYSYYDAAAMHYINKVLELDPANFEGQCLKAVVQLSQHHFTDGLATAKKVQQESPFSAFVYGILVDGYVETGRYDSAVSAAEKMMEIKPDLRSYARTSYLREIHGDYAGAIEAMKAAIDAGRDGDEQTEWCRVQLGHLYENTGDVRNASMQYTFSANQRPGYPYPLAGLARIAIANKEYDKALTFYRQADSTVNDLGFKEDIADVLRLMGKKEEAKKLSGTTLAEMEEKAKAAITDENVGHYSDKEMAEAYIKNEEYDKAVEHALAEYNRRPANIDINETLAWAWYKKGDAAKAKQYIQAAIKTNSQNPRLLCRTGLIYLQNGDKAMAKKYLTNGLNNNAVIFPSLKEESIDALNQL